MFTHSNEHWLWWSFSSQLGDRFWKEIAVNSWANAQPKFSFAAELVRIKMNADGKLFVWKLLKFVDELKLELLASLPLFLERNKLPDECIFPTSKFQVDEQNHGIFQQHRHELPNHNSHFRPLELFYERDLNWEINKINS